MLIRLIATGLLLLAGTTAHAQTQFFTQKFDDWTLVCADKSKDKNQCSVVQAVKSSAGWVKMLFAYEQDKLLFMVVVPPVATARRSVAVGNGDGKHSKQWVVYPTCNKVDCRFTWYPTPDEEVSALTNGSFIIVEYGTSKSEGLEHALSINGLRRALDEIEKAAVVKP